MQVDLLGDEPEQVDKSPHAAFWNNPIMWTDPDGKCPKCLVTLGRIAYRIFKGSDGSSASIGKVLKNEYEAISHDVKTIINGNGKSVVDATIDLVVGTDLNTKQEPAKAEEQKADDEVKNSSTYDDVTTSSRGKDAVTNKKTDVTKKDFENNLEKSGYKKTVSKDGNANVYSKDGNKYSTRSKSKDYDGPSANYKKASSEGKKPDLKIRLQKENP